MRECGKPKLFVHGENDKFGDVKKVEALIESLPGEKRLVVVPDADHFFVGKLDQLDRAITNWMSDQNF